MAGQNTVAKYGNRCKVILAARIGKPPNMETSFSINRVASYGISTTGGFHCWTIRLVIRQLLDNYFIKCIATIWWRNNYNNYLTQYEQNYIH